MIHQNTTQLAGWLRGAGYKRLAKRRAFTVNDVEHAGHLADLQRRPVHEQQDAAAFRCLTHGKAVPQAMPVIKWLLIALALLLALAAGARLAHAQNNVNPALVVTTCGAGSLTSGTRTYLQVDATGVLCTTASGGGGGGGVATTVAQGTGGSSAWLVTGSVNAIESGTWNIGTVTTITNPVAVTGTFWQTTQPISGNVGVTGTVTINTSGLATSALQTSGNASLTTIASALDVALSTRLKPADTLAGVTTVGTVTTITNPVAVSGIAGTVTINTSGLSTSALQTSGNSSLTTIAAALDVALSTRLKPADTLTGVTTVGAVTSITNPVTVVQATDSTATIAKETGGNLATVASAITTIGAVRPAVVMAIGVADQQNNTTALVAPNGILQVQINSGRLALRCNALRRTNCQ